MGKVEGKVPESCEGRRLRLNCERKGEKEKAGKIPARDEKVARQELEEGRSAGSARRQSRLRRQKVFEEKGELLRGSRGERRTRNVGKAKVRLGKAEGT